MHLICIGNLSSCLFGSEGQVKFLCSLSHFLFSSVRLSFFLNTSKPTVASLDILIHFSSAPYIQKGWSEGALEYHRHSYVAWILWAFGFFFFNFKKGFPSKFFAALILYFSAFYNYLACVLLILNASFNLCFISDDQIRNLQLLFLCIVIAFIIWHWFRTYLTHCFKWLEFRIFSFEFFSI